MKTVRIRHRAPLPTPWKWEICDGQRLLTASHESYASQFEAHRFGRRALRLMLRREGLAEASHQTKIEPFAAHHTK